MSLLKVLPHARRTGWVARTRLHLSSWSLASTAAVAGAVSGHLPLRAADGTLPEKGIQLLQKVGDWYKRVRESFDDAEPASELTNNGEVLLRGTWG